MPRSDSWKVEEIEPLVASYFKMLTMVLTMKDFRKVDIIRSLAELIPNRSEKSIEYKMQNASAVLAEHQLPHVPGYALIGHYHME
jgi:5-methylcytosine-specific restriction enzyme A